MSGKRFDDDQEPCETTNGGYRVKSKSHLDVSANWEKVEYVDAPSREWICFLRHAYWAVKIVRDNQINSEKFED
jgi:hypothetical protein